MEAQRALQAGHGGRGGQAAFVVTGPGRTPSNPPGPLERIVLTSLGRLPPSALICPQAAAREHLHSCSSGALAIRAPSGVHHRPRCTGRGGPSGLGSGGVPAAALPLAHEGSALRVSEQSPRETALCRMFCVVNKVQVSSLNHFTLTTELLQREMDPKTEPHLT